jgi:hypothetical protein
MMLLARHLFFRNLGADDLTPAHDFLRLVGARRAILDGVIILSQINDFLILYGGAFAVTRLLAGRQNHNCQGDYNNQNLFHLRKFFTAKVQFFAIAL